MPQIIIPEDRNFFSAAAKNSWAIYILTVVYYAGLGGSTIEHMISARLTEIIFKTDRIAKTCNCNFLVIYCYNSIRMVKVKLRINIYLVELQR